MPKEINEIQDIEIKRIEFKVDETGKISASIVTFGVEDLDGDIVEKTAFTDGQEVAMVWSHDWKRPIGKGVIHVTPTEAIFEGTFFMDTVDGQEAYKTVKAMDNLQEWSWGFHVTKRLIEETENGYIRHILEAEVYEVSPVLKGAGVGTRTLAIKGKSSLEVEIKETLELVSLLGERVRSVKGMRAKEDRDLSEKRKTDLTTLVSELRNTADELEKNLAPVEDLKAQGQREYTKYLKTQAILNGMGKE